MTPTPWTPPTIPIGAMSPPYPLVDPTWLTAKVDTYEGWCTAAKAVRLAELVALTKGTLSVELGVFGGRSLLALAVGHAWAERGYALGIDPFQTAPTLEGTNDPENDRWWAALDLQAVLENTARRLFEDAPRDRWQLLRTTSHDGREYVADGTVTLLHQDSNHSEEVSNAELDRWASALAPGGLWVCDDADWPTLQVVQYRLKETYGYRLIEDYVQWRVYQAPVEPR